MVYVIETSIKAFVTFTINGGAWSGKTLQFSLMSMKKWPQIPVPKIQLERIKFNTHEPVINCGHMIFS